jgi:hypothetical protein
MLARSLSVFRFTSSHLPNLCGALTLGLLLGVPSLRADNSTETFFGLDLNKNHLSEFFEQQYPSAIDPHADTDGDGQDNMQESAAGTNPTDSGSRLDFSNIAASATTVTASYPTVRGKRYQMQMSTSLASGWANEGTPVVGAGTPITDSCPTNGSRVFLRLQVTDTDSDNDGVSDWEEYQAGTNPLDTDTEGNGVSDYDMLSRKLNLPSTVEVIAQDASGSEGGDPISYKIIRRGNLNPLVVNLSWSGTATNGTDYSTPATSVSLPFGATSAVVTVTPLSDVLVESPNETVVLTLATGANYALGNMTSATGTIYPVGLTAKIYDNSSATYNASSPAPAAGTYANGAINFLPADLKETRIDANINFNTATAGNLWFTGAKPSTLLVDDNYHSIVWTGSVRPRYNETYTFFSTANTGSRLWVNGVKLLVDTAWTNAAELSGTIALQAGKSYDLMLEWHDELNTSIAELRWSSASQAKELIPTSQLFTGPSAVPAVNSLPFAVAFVGGPFSYQISATNTPTSFAAGGLPTGLTVNAAGLISGIPTSPAGLYFVNLTASNAAGTGSLPLSLLVIQAGGGLTRDVWSGATTASVVDIPLTSPPAATSTTTDFSAPSNTDDNFSERLSGYITAPTTGTYTFFLTTEDENAELWLSGDDDPSRLLKRSFLTNTSAGGNYGVVTSQKSLGIKLQAGKRYYVESRRKETTGNDQFKVGWSKPGESTAAPTETVPGYVLTPASIGVPQGGKGTLYVATLTPQSGATTFGNGTAVLLVNEAQTRATMSYTYSGLTGPITNQHIHDGASLPGPVGAILYDVDTNTPDSFGVYTWDFVQTGNHTVENIKYLISAGTAYLNLHTAAYPNGEIKGFFQKATGVRTFVPPAPPTVEALPTLDDNEAVRFLTQASMGARRDTNGVAPWDVDSIENVKALGLSAWIDEQLNLPAGNDPELTVIQVIPNPDPPVATSVADPLYVYTPFRTVMNGNGPMATFVKDYYTKFPRVGTGTGNLDQSSAELFKGWWKFAVTNPDQLRQRVGFALTQILVVSEQGVFDENARAMAQYYDVMNYYAFGNFRTLLEKITLNVPMGRYLDMFRNKKASTTSVPNENYAREIMQLFSIGLNRIHPDGTLALSAQGFPVPTYAQEQVVGLSHVFTGWSFNGDNTSFNAGSTNYMLPMIPFPTQHSPLEKNLLDNTVIPALAVPTTQSTTDELQQSIDLIFHHPNVGPFISRQLIQRMVTANPSPGYIYRVATAFADNGSGVRGDMKAVIKAILLDPDARYASIAAQPEFGHLKEPVLRVTQVLRALRGYSTSALYNTVNQLPHAQVATQANIDLTIPLPVDVNNLVFVDGIRLWPGMRVLVKSQTVLAENGLYDYTGPTANLARSASADAASEFTSAYVRVSYGTSTTKTFRQTATVTTLGTDAITWADNGGGNVLGSQWNVGETGSDNLFQTPLKAPTVFNFYEPDYRFPGATGNAKLYGPEFQILSETSIVKTINLYYNLTHTNHNDLRMEFTTRPSNALQLPYPWPVSLAGTYTNDLDNPEIAIAGNTTTLLDRLNTLMLGGRMSSTLRGHLTTYINTMPSATTANKKARVQDAVYLIMLSHEYSIQK